MRQRPNPLPLLAVVLLLAAPPCCWAGHPGSQSRVAAHCVGCTPDDCEKEYGEEQGCVGCAVCRIRDVDETGAVVTKTTKASAKNDDDDDDKPAQSTQKKPGGNAAPAPAVCEQKGPMRGGDDEVKFCERWCKEDSCDDCRCKLCGHCGGPLGKEHRCKANPSQAVYCEGWCDASFTAQHCGAGSKCACEGCDFCSHIGHATKACVPSNFQDVSTEQCSSWCTERCGGVLLRPVSVLCTRERFVLRHDQRHDHTPTTRVLPARSSVDICACC